MAIKLIIAAVLLILSMWAFIHRYKRAEEYHKDKLEHPGPLRDDYEIELPDKDGEYVSETGGVLFGFAIMFVLDAFEVFKYI